MVPFVTDYRGGRRRSEGESRRLEDRRDASVRRDVGVGSSPRRPPWTRGGAIPAVPPVLQVGRGPRPEAATLGSCPTIRTTLPPCGPSTSATAWSPGPPAPGRRPCTRSWPTCAHRASRACRSPWGSTAAPRPSATSPERAAVTGGTTSTRRKGCALRRRCCVGSTMPRSAGGHLWTPCGAHRPCRDRTRSSATATPDRGTRAGDGDEAVGLLDWDFLHPAPRVDDVAYALRWFAPLRPDAEALDVAPLPEVPDRRSRVAAFLDAYGPLPAFDVTEAVASRARRRSRSSGAGRCGGGAAAHLGRGGQPRPPARRGALDPRARRASGPDRAALQALGASPAAAASRSRTVRPSRTLRTPSCPGVLGRRSCSSGRPVGSARAPSTGGGDGPFRPLQRRAQATGVTG